MTATSERLFEGADWDFRQLQRIHEACEEIAHGELGLDTYPNQIEIITAEQMLDAYSSVGMPLFYHHWSFGKHFARDEKLYRKGYTGLAYEIVINSTPCISYMMEENTMTMQALVTAHAAFGHNHFFKNNYVFKQWTDPKGILDYLQFARNFIARCEERHGIAAVERILDAAHALMDQGIDRYTHRARPNLIQERLRAEARREHERTTYNELWRTLPIDPNKPKPTATTEEIEAGRRRLGLPEENILYFIEKFAPKLQDWEREVLRIVRNIAQYFYPQKQTKMMNEGCATFVHYTIMNRLYEQGLLTEGAMLEFIDYHTRVVFQPEFDDRRYSGINPYALGFAMMSDIERMCTAPTAEDRAFLPDIAGNGDPMGTLRTAWADFRDDAFVLQFLSPHLIRKLRLFKIDDDPDKPEMRVDAIHDERGYARVRKSLSRYYEVGLREPDIQVSDVDLTGDRRLVLTHKVRDGVPIEEHDARAVLAHVAALWGYDVKLHGINAEADTLLYSYEASPPPA
jgi:spore cortex formation protein SpoVR/YcgB (stage V sporulation)